ncbi:L-glyceraldehyde 3-phosphate reductase [candidate division KSB1 bacterium]|nr:L-glyceraldehyde 3-phosphate reductase [candidate division KSB1 bacterium]
MNYQANEKRYESMVYRRCGRSGLQLPAISLGLWHNFGAVDEFETGRKILRCAFDRGITHFDLANNYGPPPGSAEETFGKILKLDFKSYRDEMIISTKAGYLMWPGPYGEWGSRKYLLASLDQSLKRLGLDYVDIFYSHRPDPDTPLQETLSALAQAVHQGKSLYAGISNYSAEMTAQAAGILRDMGAPCLIHQPAYSMFNRWIEGDLVETLRGEGIGCIVFSPLAQGMLTDRYLQGIPKDSRAGKPHGFLKPQQITTEKMAQVRALHTLAQNRGQSLAQMAIAWALRLPEVSSALVGVSSVEQLEDNLKTLNQLQFSAEELSSIDAILT